MQAITTQNKGTDTNDRQLQRRVSQGCSVSAELRKVCKKLDKAELEVAELRSQKWELMRRINPNFNNQ